MLLDCRQCSEPLSARSRYYYTTVYYYTCVLTLLYMCPHTTTHVSSCYYICVLILLYMCPHTAIYVSSYYNTCVLMLLYMCPHTTIYVSAYCYICVLILLHMCPHTTRSAPRLPPCSEPLSTRRTRMLTYSDVCCYYICVLILLGLLLDCLMQRTTFYATDTYADVC